jgi:hypothetical protein
MKRGLFAILLSVSLLAASASMTAEAQELVFVSISDKLAELGFNPEDTPFGIECGDPDFVYVTIEEQGLLARINKNTRIVEQIFNDPDGVENQGFFSIARTSAGHLFINERGTGKLWRFDPATEEWTRIPIVPRVMDPPDPDGILPHPYVEYPGIDNSFVNGYETAPHRIILHESNGQTVTFENALTRGDGTVVFANGFIWVGLTFFRDWDAQARADGLPILNFTGLAKVDPLSLEVRRINVTGANEVTGLVVDPFLSNIIWITDFVGSRVIKFNFATETVEAIIQLSEPFDETNPRGIAVDLNNVYVALDKPFQFEDQQSEIARINKSTLAFDIIQTGAPLTDEGTFSVFVVNTVLIWTDQSRHIGTIDLINESKDFIITQTDSNHFGCLAREGEFWFAGRGSADVGIATDSRFSGGRPVSPNGNRGVRRDDDKIGPSIADYYWSPGIPTAGESLTIAAYITDDVMVEHATVFYYGEGEDPRNAHAITMSQLNVNWFSVGIPGSEVKEPGISFWINALDPSGNSYSTDVKSMDVQKGNTVQSRVSNTNLPSHVREAIKPKVTTFTKLEVVSLKSNSAITTFHDEIVIKNVGNARIDNVRIILSPEISKSFRINEYAIKSIEPNSNVTITFNLNGSPNRNTMGGILGYTGELMVMAEHHSPILLPVRIGASESVHLNDYMQRVASMAEARYSKVSLLNKLVKVQENESDMVLSTSSGRMVTDPSDELLIKNTSEKQLNNIRIVLSKAGNAFLLDRSNIKTLAPGESASVQLVPMIDSSKYSPRDYAGEIIVVADNGLPQTIPIRIIGHEERNSMDEFEVSTTSGGIIKTVSETITIRNNAERPMDSVKIVMDSNLARVFALSKYSFMRIEPGESVTIHFAYRNGNVKTFMQNFNGEIRILSEHHNMHVIPVDIKWESVDGKHFAIYTHGDVTYISDILEDYQKIKLVEMESRAAIYIASAEEMQLLNNGHAFYSYMDDAIFIPDSADIEYDALRMIVYRLLINNYATYHNMKQFTFTHENWLLDGMASYIASDLMNDKRYLNAFARDKDTYFQWYGYGSDAQYGATHEFFSFLENRYGEKVIDRILQHMGTGMVSNHKCDSVETCAVLSAVYDAAGMDMNKRKYTQNFVSLAEEWKAYVESNRHIIELQIPVRSIYAYQIE